MDAATSERIEQLLHEERLAELQMLVAEAQTVEWLEARMDMEGVSALIEFWRPLPLPIPLPPGLKQFDKWPSFLPVPSGEISSEETLRHNLRESIANTKARILEDWTHLNRELRQSNRSKKGNDDSQDHDSRVLLRGPSTGELMELNAGPRLMPAP